jgi:long-chain acyl-CoA synthetase
MTISDAILAEEGNGCVTRTATTMSEAFRLTADMYADKIALRNADGSVEMTFAEYAARVRRVSAALARLGVTRGDAVGLMMSNRPEFHICDTAAIQLGATPYSIYNTLPAHQIAHLFRNAGNAVTIAEEQYLDRLRLAAAEAQRPQQLVTVDQAESGGAALSLAELEAVGDDDFDFHAAWSAVTPNDVLTIVYTSGTTGPPKGVELTHGNMLAECRANQQVMPMPSGLRVMSYLPAAHISDRWMTHYSQMMFGTEITTIHDLSLVPGVLRELRPAAWGGVPRFLEKVAAAIQAAIAAEVDPHRARQIRQAVELGLEKIRREDAGEAVSRELQTAWEQADHDVFRQLRAHVGLDRAEWILVGGAPMPQADSAFLRAIGLPILDAFGMSECSCAVTGCAPGQARRGSVGRALPGVDLKLADDGELLVRGPIVMRGYRDDPQRTEEAIDAEDWLHTGDLARIDDDGFVYIVGRKKDLIINAAGKTMSPANIESEIEQTSALIGRAMVIGDSRPYLVALIVLDPEVTAMHARSEAGLAQLASSQPVHDELDSAIARANERLARVEQIKRYAVVPDVWIPGGDFMTPTMKLKRAVIAKHYQETINELYSEVRAYTDAPRAQRVLFD